MILIRADVEPSLGEQLKESLRSEAIFPAFQYGEFKAASRSPGLSNIVHFTADNFFEGMNNKVHKLLQHVEQCIESFGETAVLL